MRRNLNVAPSIVIDGVTINVVEVSIIAIDQDGGIPNSGNLHFEVDDLVWITALNSIAVIDPIDVYANGGFTGEGVLYLLAMDNEGFSTNWSWVMSGSAGESSFTPRKLTVNYANGAQQTLTSLLDASTPVS
jgi:hypothetical protein